MRHASPRHPRPSDPALFALLATRYGSAADHLTRTGDRFRCFRRPVYVRTAFFAIWKGSCSGARPAVSSSSSRAPSLSMGPHPRLFKEHAVAIEFSVVRTPQWTPRGALSGFRSERTVLRLYMSLCSHDSSIVTDVVRIGCSCALLHARHNVSCIERAFFAHGRC